MVGLPHPTAYMAIRGIAPTGSHVLSAAVRQGTEIPGVRTWNVRRRPGDAGPNRRTAGDGPRSGGAVGGANGAYGLVDGGVRGLGAAQRVEHDEVVDDALVADGGDGDAGGAQLVGVRFALVAQNVGL